VVQSNDDTLTPEDLALGSKQLMHVERAWRLLKSGLRIRPLFHWAPHRICAHVSLTILALLLERLAERACGDTWRNIRNDLRQIKLAQFSPPQGELWQVTEPLLAAANRLKQLGIPPTHARCEDRSATYAHAPFALILQLRVVLGVHGIVFVGSVKLEWNGPSSREGKSFSVLPYPTRP